MSADWAYIAALFAGCVLFIATIIGGAIAFSRHQEQVRCAGFARETNRETRFVVYNTFNWACLTPTGDGKWIPTDQLREFSE